MRTRAMNIVLVRMATSFLPAIVNENIQPRFLSSREKEFRDVLNYMERICKSQKIETRFTVEGDEVVVGA